MFIVFIYCSLGMMLGFITATVHSALRGNKLKLYNILCHKCPTSPTARDLLRLPIGFIQGKCGVCGNPYDKYHYLTCTISAIQFTTIAWTGINSLTIALLCLFFSCFNFLILNVLSSQICWEKPLHGLMLLIVVIYAALDNTLLVQHLITPIAIFVAVYVVKIGAKLFIGSDALSPPEIKILVISSIMLPLSSLSAYLLLLAAIAFIWALCWKSAFKKRQHPSMIPAIGISLFICLIFPKLTALVTYNVLTHF